MAKLRDIQKEETIKQKALELIVKEGFDGMSMHKLAKAAKVSAGTIYIYFKDREDLIVRIGIDEEQKMLEATLKDFDPEMNFDTGLKIQWYNRAKYFLENPKRMHFMEQLRYSKYADNVKAVVKSDFLKKMSRFTQKAIDEKQLVQLPIEIYWSLAFAPLYQLVKFHVNKKGLHNNHFTLDKNILEQTISIVLKGLKP